VADERRAAFKGLAHALDLRRGTRLRSARVLAIALLLAPLRGLRVGASPDLLRVKADFFLRRGDSNTSSAAVVATCETSSFGLLATFLLLLTRFSSSRFASVLLSAFSVRRFR
jgi:hypothetical protein